MGEISDGLGQVKLPSHPGGPGAGGRTPARAEIKRWLWLTAMVLVAVPIVADITHGVRGGWRPIGDNAIIVQRALDVGTADNPEVGMPSAIGVWSSQTGFHPGPLVFWSLAPAARMAPGSGTPVLITVGLVRLACSMAVLLVAGRLAGRAGLLSAVAALLVGLGIAYPLHEPLNPSIAFSALVATPFLCWATLGGLRWAPVGFVLVASYSAQADLGFLPVVIPLALLAGHAIAGRWRADRDRGPLMVSFGVGVACWALPVWQASVNGGGNVRSVSSAVTAGIVPSMGLAGIPGLGTDLVPAALAAASCFLLRRSTVAAERVLVPVVMASLVGLALTAWLRPEDGSVTPAYALQAIVVILCFAPGLALLRWAGGLVRSPRVAGATSVVLVSLLAISTVPHAQHAAAPDRGPYHAAYDAADELAGVIEDEHGSGSGPLVVRTANSFDDRDVAITTVVALRRRGFDVAVSDGLVPYFGSLQDAQRVPSAPEYWVVDGRAPGPPVPGARLIGRWTPAQADADASARVAAEVRQVVRRAGEVSVIGPPSVVELTLNGWDEIEEGWRRDSGSLIRAPGAVLVALYLRGAIEGSDFGPELVGRIYASSAAHPIAVWVATPSDSARPGA